MARAGLLKYDPSEPYDLISYEVSQTKKKKKKGSGGTVGQFDPYAVESSSPFMRNPDYIAWQTGYTGTGTSGSSGSSFGTGTGSTGTTATTPSNAAASEAAAAVASGAPSGTMGQGTMYPAVDEPVSMWSSGYNRFGEPIPQFSEISGDYATRYPAAGVLATLRQFGGTSNLTNPYTSFLLENFAPGAEMLFRLTAEAPDPSQFLGWMQDYMGDLTAPLGSVDKGTSPLFSFGEFMDLVRALVSGDQSGLGSVWTELMSNQDPEQQARMLASLLRSAGLTSVSGPLLDAMERDLQNQLYNYYVYVMSAYDPNNERGTPTSLADYLRNIGWFQTWLGRWM